MKRRTIALALLVVLFAVAWTSAVLRSNNVERQGGDIVHHALLVQESIDSSLSAPSFFINYPRTSHVIAAWFARLFDHDPIRGMRCVALISLGLMIVAQFELLRFRLSTSSSMLMLFVWQMVCTAAKVGDVNHFLWEGQYNFSRAAGAVGMWFALLALANSSDRPECRFRDSAVPLLLATFATLCHLVPGAFAFGAIVVYFLSRALVERSRASFIVAAISGIVGVGVFLASSSRSMAVVANAGGWLPTALEPLLWLWAPMSIAVFIELLHHCRRTDKIEARQDGVAMALNAACLASAALQFALLAGRSSGHISDYSYKSALFYTFQFASLLLFHWMTVSFQRWRPQWQLDFASRPVRLGIHGAAFIAAVLGIAIMLKKDAVRPNFGVDRDAIQVVRKLRAMNDWSTGSLYIDPLQPFAGYFVNLTIAQVEPRFACEIADRLRQSNRLDWLWSDPQIKELVLPAAENPSELFSTPIACRRLGDFWLVRPESANQVAANPETRH